MQVLLERPAEVIYIYMFPSSSGHYSSDLDVQAFLNCLSRISIRTVLPSSGPKISKLRFGSLATSKRNYEGRNVSLPRMPVASINL